MADVSIAAYLTVILTLLFVSCVLIVLYYAEPGFPWHSYITLTCAAFAAFGILLLVPIDIAAIVYDRRASVSGSYNYDIDTLGVFYDTFFTMVLVLGSVVLVFEEYYNTDGYFTLGGRILSSLKRMCLANLPPVVVGVIILGILLGQHVVSNNASALKLAAVIVTNTCYELGLMFLLGYSFVEFPRSIWIQSEVEWHLLQTQQRAAAQFKTITDAQLSVSLAVSDVLKTKAQLSSYADPALAQAMDILMAECPSEFRSDRMGKVAANKQGQVTIDTLAALRTRLNSLKDAYRQAQAKVDGIKMLAYTLEDLVAAKKQSSNSSGPRTIHWTLQKKDSTEWEYKYYLVYRPLLLKAASVVCAVLSILSLIGVACSMSGVSNDASPYYQAVHNDSAQPGGIVVFIWITLGYTLYITTWSVFQMKLGASKEMVPSRTTPEALSFNVRMIARLAAPLAFFYLGWISENGLRTGDFVNNEGSTTYNVTVVPVFNTTTNTTTYINQTMEYSSSIEMNSAFSNFYQLQNIKAVQRVFGTIFPIILFIVLGLSLLNIFNRLLVLLKLEDYQFGAEIVTEEVLREGKRQLERHKRNTERAFQRGDLKSFIQRVTSAPDTQGGGFFSSFFAPAKHSVKTAKDMLDLAGETSTIKEPQALKGLVERKGAFKLGGGAWKTIFLQVRSPGFLYLFRDERLAESTPPQHSTSGVIPPAFSDTSSSYADIHIVDLRLVLDFRIPEKSGSAGSDLEIETVQETIKLRFKTSEERESWRLGLQDWKDFAVDFLATYAATPSALEANRTSSSSNTPSVDYNQQSTTKTPLYDLDSIQVGGDEEAGDEVDTKGGFLSSSTTRSNGGGGGLFGMGRKSKAAPSLAPLAVHDGRPAPLEGWLEKKGHSKVHVGAVGENWQKRYLRIDESSTAVVYTKSSDPKEKPSGVINLQLVRDITVYEKNGSKDYSRFNIDLGDRVYKFRAGNDADGRRWVDGLNAWRDYFLLNI